MVSYTSASPSRPLKRQRTSKRSNAAHALRIQCILYSLEQQGVLPVSRLDAEIIRLGPKRSSSGTITDFQIQTESDALILRSFASKCSERSDAGHAALQTALLMTYLGMKGSSSGAASPSFSPSTHAIAPSPPSGTTDGRRKEVALAIPRLVAVADDNNNSSSSSSSKPPWVLFHRPRGQPLEQVLGELQRTLRVDDWCQVAKALARLQASIWGVGGVTGSGPLEVDLGTKTLISKRDTPVDGREHSASQTLLALSQASTVVCCEQSSHTLGDEDTWASSPSIDPYSSFIYGIPLSDCIPADKSIIDVQLAGPDCAFAKTPTKATATTSEAARAPSQHQSLSTSTGMGQLRILIFEGLLRQRTQCIPLENAASKMARIDRIIKAAEILLEKDDNEGVFDINGSSFLLELPELNAHNIFIAKNLGSSIAHTSCPSSTATASTSSPSPRYNPAAHSSSWDVTGLTELGSAKGIPAPLAVASILTSESIWAKLLWSQSRKTPTSIKIETKAEPRRSSRPRKRRTVLGSWNIPAPKLGFDKQEQSSDNESDFEFEDAKKEAGLTSKRHEASYSRTNILDEDQLARDRMLRAFFSELCNLIPNFEHIYRRASSSKFVELYRLAQASPDERETSLERDERVVLEAADETKRRQKDRQTASALPSRSTPQWLHQNHEQESPPFPLRTRSWSFSI
ncbi:hypothetical protein OC861_005123 [Tilletia horrida]|nr:hypothetical protein OC861_005123 [Tilletia horrida]